MLIIFRRLMSIVVVLACLAVGAAFAKWLTPRWDLLATMDHVLAVVALAMLTLAAGMAWAWGRRG